MPETTEQVQEEVVFKTVGEFIDFLKGQGEATVAASEVAATLEAIQAAAKGGKRRGQLNGVALEDMTLAQLKREKINANSVHYKAVKRGAPQETIDANKARLDAVNARIAALTPAAEEPASDEAVEAADVKEEVAAEL